MIRLKLNNSFDYEGERERERGTRDWTIQSIKEEAALPSQEMGLWTLLEGFLLLANAFAILNEDRFLAPRGWSFSEFSVGRTKSLKGQLIGLIYATQYMRVPLIILNSICIFVKLILYVNARNTLTGVDVFYARYAFEVATRSGCQVIGIMNSAYNHTICYATILLHFLSRELGIASLRCKFVKDGVQWKRFVVSRAPGEYFEAILKDF
ncbi:hypothetical protein NC652_026383 [Populus alba x Populus x berolinensis]|nr:hypothetical protein NC652_026383 [Populus alba x Populus x berolinensis]